MSQRTSTLTQGFPQGHYTVAMIVGIFSIRQWFSFYLYLTMYFTSGSILLILTLLNMFVLFSEPQCGYY